MILLIGQDFATCGPEKESCIAKQSLTDSACLVACTGLYADVADDSLIKTTEDLKQTTQTLIKGDGDLKP